jgi:hypothetical protein
MDDRKAVPILELSKEMEIKPMFAKIKEVFEDLYAKIKDILARLEALEAAKEFDPSTIEGYTPPAAPVAEAVAKTDDVDPNAPLGTLS